MTDDSRAVIARRAATAPVGTAEIERLTRAAGHEVVEVVTQVRPPDGAYNLGSGKAEEAVKAIATHDADILVVDNDLTPTQTWNLAKSCPEDTRVVDRYRLVLDIFASGTGDRAAELQVELATLEYDLPRVRNAVGERDHALSKRTEKGTPIQDLESRIETVRRNLRSLEQTHAERRRQRREQGFDLVALAGYTNAGKSTLLHRLADDLSLSDLGTEHSDLTETAAVEDRLFKTLETTTRRSTLDGRRLLVTDTVGLLDELPHELVESFETTVVAATDADLTVVVVDAADDPRDVRRKLETSLDVLEDAHRRLIVLNKRDKLAGEDLSDREEVVRSLTDDPVVSASATAGDLADLEDRIAALLPDQERLSFDLPHGGETESFLAWLHDRTAVETVEYGGASVSVTATARPEVAEEARGRAPPLESA